MRVETQPWPTLRVSLELVFGGSPVTGSTVLVTLYRISDGNYWNGASWVGAPATFTVSEPYPSAFPGLYTVAVPPASVDYAAGEEGYIAKVFDPGTGTLEMVFIAQGVQPWRDLRADHTGAGTFGEGVNVATLATGSIVSATFAAGAIDAAAIGTGAIDADAIATDAIDADAIAAGAIDADAIAVGAIEADAFAADAISAGALATSAVNEIVDGVLDEAISGHTVGGSVGESLIRVLALRQNNNRVVYTAWNTAGVPTAGTVYIYATQADMLADVGGTGAGSIGSYAITASFDGSLRPTEYTSGKVT